jgi:hypothetical protein
MGREPLKTFAARDDPWVIHGQLREERRTHLEALEGAPPFVRGQLIDARRELASAEERRRRLAGELQRLSEEHAATSPLAQLRRRGRKARADAEAGIVEVRDALRSADRNVTRASAQFDQLQAAHEYWHAFESGHGWRRQRVVAIDDQLAHHWARAALGAVREDDPLAFGIDELRRARGTYATDLGALLAGLPPDRSGALRQATADSRRAGEILRFARREVANRAQDLEAAQQRHWGRRDESAIAHAASRLSEADADLANARKRATRARERLVGERASEAARHRALDATKDERTALGHALDEINGALEATRVQRVLGLVRDDAPPLYILETLGEVPLSRGGQRAWCGLAFEIERYRDRYAVTNEFMAVGAEPQLRRNAALNKEWTRMCDLIGDARAIVEVAHAADPVGRDRMDPADACTWRPSVVDAQQRLESMRELATRDLGRGSEPDLGISW